MPDTMETTPARDRLIRADDVVETLEDAPCSGRLLPAGSIGRVAYADQGSGWHSIVFDVPIAGSALLPSTAVRRYDGRPSVPVPGPLRLQQGEPTSPDGFREHEPVRTLVTVEEDGVMVLAGSRGTIVHMWDGGRYEVEFASPEPCVITMAADQIAH